MSTSPGKFVWFEHLSPEPAKARPFYEALFGWQFEAMPMGDGPPYLRIMNGSDGIGGLRSGEAGAPSHWMSYLSVPDVDAAHRSALAAGAKSLLAPVDFGGVGRGAALADPTGAVFSIWRDREGDRPERITLPAGEWYWNELMTGDEKAALVFYEKVFGFDHEVMNMGAKGDYYVLKKDGVSRAGLLRSPMPDTAPMWLPYVKVAGCDAIAAKATQLGARVVVQPTDVPEIGRFTVAIDPLGAAIAAIQPAK